MKDEGGRMKDEIRVGLATRCRSRVASSFILHPSSFLLLLALASGFASAARAADSISVEQLAAQKSKWPSYAASGLPMKIEGRYLIFSSKLLRFMKCEDLNFVWHDEEQTFPVDLSAPRSRTIEVYGRFALDSGKPLFRVERVRELPADAESLRVRRLEILEAASPAWYALGDWALGRGTFYGDFELQNEARKLYAEGIQRELKALPDDALDARLAVAEKFRKFGLPEHDRIAVVFEAFVNRWLVVQAKKPTVADLDQLTDRLSENLRGCRTPLDESARGLAERFQKDPAAFYRDASPATRLKLNRFLYAEIRYASLQAWAKQKSQDGLQLADAIDREIPERHAEAEKLREQTLDERLASAATLSRSDVLKLADRFNQRGETEKATQAKKTWVLAGDERLRKEGRPDDLIQAAHEHQSFLDDNDGAAKLLIEAYEISPGMKEISEQLERLGWARAGGKWVTKREAAALPPDAAKQAAEAGQLVGMTRDQVRKVLASRPDSVTRIISAGQLNEVWIYKPNMGARLAVHFLGSTDGHDLRVVKLVQ
jgi:hypothetical protein